MMKCYGKYSKNKSECKSCELADYCKDSKDPAPLTYNHYDTVNGDIISLDTGETISLSEHAEVLAEAFRHIINVTRANPTRMAIIISRFSGLSYSEIGRHFGISKQAIHKHIKYIANNNNILGKMLVNRTTEIECLSSKFKQNEGEQWKSRIKQI